jgi:Flp pilus assembly pilin Flp
MSKLYVWFKGLLSSERGQDMVEYALITAAISLVIVGVTIGILDDAFFDWATNLAGEITTVT